MWVDLVFLGIVFVAIAGLLFCEWENRLKWFAEVVAFADARWSFDGLRIGECFGLVGEPQFENSITGRSFILTNSAFCLEFDCAQLGAGIRLCTGAKWRLFKKAVW